MRVHIIIPGLYPINNQTIGSAVRQSCHPNVMVIQDQAKMNALDSSDHLCVWDHMERFYAARNIYAGIALCQPKDEDVICILDGDDKLTDANSLVPVVAAYQDRNVLLTYGSYKTKSGQNSKSFNGEYRAEESFRSARWKASHLKTFRYNLFKRLSEKALKGPNGEWLKVCSDVAIMLPLLEMAGYDRIWHINKFIYEYNDMNPLNDHKVAGKEQKDIEMWLRTRKPYDRIEL